MASASKTAIAVGADWVDLTVSDATLANIDVDLQFNGRVDHAVAEYRLSGADPTAAVSGRTLKSGESVSVNSDHIWVRAPLGGYIYPIAI